MNAHYAKLLPAKLDGYCNFIKSKIYTKIGTLTLQAYVTEEPVSFSDRMSGRKIAPKQGDVWGKLWDCAWFHVTGAVPKDCKADKIVVRLDISGEALIVDGEGNPVRGLTCVDSEFDRTCGLPGKTVYDGGWKAGDRIDFWMDAGNNDLFGKYCGGTVRLCDIAACDEKVRKLYYDFLVLHDLMKVLSPESPRYYAVLYALNAAGEVVADFTAEHVDRAIALLAPELAKRGGTPSLSLYATGHAHLDLGWLWPIRETKRKAARTFSTALANMERYPDYVFGQSQPQQYVWIKENYPDLYRRIREYVQAGRLEPQGAMWVEADTNLSGGEALVRQILYGKKFYKEEFGKEVEILHLPDVFGYSAALPQILKKSGVPYFLSIKMSWCKNNVFPYNSFHWVGMDGSRVLVHFPPEGNYLSSALPRAVKKAADGYAEKGLSDSALILYGIGDGGGGPGAEHLESLQRIGNLEGISPIRQAQTIEFFHALEKDAEKLPSYKGELYLEMHQGTYTTQAENKRYNRLSERLLRDTEIVCALRHWQFGETYPACELETIWKEVLLYQFHDILPGSSIRRVYDESLARYAVLEKALRDMLAARMGTGNEVLNTLSWTRTEVRENDGKLYRITVPALGTASLASAEEVRQSTVGATADTLYNEYVTAVFNENGAIISLQDADGFEAIDGEANVLMLYCDGADAWDFDPEYRNKPTHRAVLRQMRSYTEGACAVREQTFSVGVSTCRQVIRLRQESKYLEIENEVDWWESEKMLRIDGTFAVLTDRVACDVQFGYIERSVLNNTSLDFAQFEICAHKYVDLRNDGCGVALFNDCKYGYRAKGSQISMNVLRSTSYPGENADKGIHRFRYALYPHSSENRVEKLAYEFNYPLHYGVSPMAAPFAIENEHIVTEAVKLSESGQAIVVRLFNNGNAPQSATIRLDSPYCVTLGDLMENPLRDLPLAENAVTVPFKPFEIHTLLLQKEIDC